MQTQTKKRLLIWTLFSATLKQMVWKMRKLKAYLRPSLNTCCRNLFERTEEKRRRIWASDSFQFSAQFKLKAILRRNIHLTYPIRTISSKNPETSLQRSESHLFWHEHGKGNKRMSFLSHMSSFELIFTASNLDFHLTLTWSIFCN